MARLVIDLPENSPGCIYSTGQVRLPASVGLGWSAANSPQAHANPSWNAEAPGKNLGAARGMAEGTGLSSSPRPESGARWVRRAPRLSRRNVSP